MTTEQTIDATAISIAEICGCEPDFDIARRYHAITRARYWLARVPILRADGTDKRTQITGATLDDLEAAAAAAVAKHGGQP